MCFSTPPQHSKLASFTEALCSFYLTLTYNSGFTISPQDTLAGKLKQPGLEAPMNWCIAAPNELQPNLKTLGHLFLEISCPQDFQKTCPKTLNPSRCTSTHPPCGQWQHPPRVKRTQSADYCWNMTRIYGTLQLWPITAFHLFMHHENSKGASIINLHLSSSWCSMSQTHSHWQ